MTDHEYLERLAREIETLKMAVVYILVILAGTAAYFFVRMLGW